MAVEVQLGAQRVQERRSEASGDKIGFLRCTMIEEGMHKPQKWGFLWIYEEPVIRLGFPMYFTICLTYRHCLPILISLIYEPTVPILQEYQDGKIWPIMGHFCRSRMDFIHVCLHRFCFCYPCMKVS